MSSSAACSAVDGSSVYVDWRWRLQRGSALEMYDNAETTDDATVFAVYDADGSLRGEVAYVVGKLLGTRACALCDISHGLNPLGKTDWRTGRGSAPAVTWLHRDEQPQELAAFTQGQLPAVVVQRGEGYAWLMRATDLAACEGDYAAFTDALRRALATGS